MCLVPFACRQWLTSVGGGGGRAGGTASQLERPRSAFEELEAQAAAAKGGTLEEQDRQQVENFHGEEARKLAKKKFMGVGRRNLARSHAVRAGVQDMVDSLGSSAGRRRPASSAAGSSASSTTPSAGGGPGRHFLHMSRPLDSQMSEMHKVREQVPVDCPCKSSFEIGCAGLFRFAVSR